MENLEWVTQSENIKHAYRIGIKSNKLNKHPRWGKLHSPESIERMRKSHIGKIPSVITRMKMRKSHLGKNNLLTKLTNNKVYQIKMLLKLGFKGIEIAKIYNVSDGIISRIKTGKTWTLL